MVPAKSILSCTNFATEKTVECADLRICCHVTLSLSNQPDNPAQSGLDLVIISDICDKSGNYNNFVNRKKLRHVTIIH